MMEGKPYPLPETWTGLSIGKVVVKAKQRDPRKTPAEEFQYVDVSAVSNTSFKITSAAPTLGSEAPSRARKAVETDDVLFATVRPTLKRIALVPPELNGAIASTGYCVLRCDKAKAEPGFLYSFLITDHFNARMAGLERGASYPAVRDSDVMASWFPLPPLAEQKKIAHILSTVQRAIEAQERIIQTTTELKKALMHKLFTEGLRHEPQKQTEIGPVPESWEVVPLGKYARVLNGYAFKSVDYVREGIRVIRISNVSTGFLIDKDDKYLPTSYLEKRSAYALKAGDLILSLTRPIIKEGMKYCFIEEQHLPALLNQRVGRFEITDPRLRKDYLFQIIFSPYFIAPLKYMAEGSNQPNVSPTRLEAFQVPIPTDMEEQEQIAKLLTGLNRKMELAKQKASQLQDLFRTLLHELMTAKTRVHKLKFNS